jgi:GTPase SAR1 family protein
MTIETHLSHRPFILVGTKLDRREKHAQDEMLISSSQGQHVAKEIGACTYMECSALTQENVRAVLYVSIHLLHFQLCTEYEASVRSVQG